MKIKTRILLINFTIVALILISSAFAFYSIMYNVLSSQQSQYLLNSKNDFIFAYREVIQEAEEDFIYIYKNNLDATFLSGQLQLKNIDFIVETSNNKIIRYVTSNLVEVPQTNFSVNEFENLNPYAILKKYESDNKTYYFGRILSESLLNNLSKKIGAEIAAVWNNTATEVSNSSANQKFYHLLNKPLNNSSEKNDQDIYSLNSESTDLLATVYKPSKEISKNNQIDYIIFTTLSEITSLRSSITDILIIIGFAGIVLALILTFVFTDTIRKNITKLSYATKLTKEGNLNNRISVKSKDELGQLAGAFNNMLDVIEKNQKARQEYSEFITLINQNPSLSEISEASLNKIISTCGFTAGALYSVDNNTYSLLSNYGYKSDTSINKTIDLFDSVIKSKERIEIFDNKKLPVISGGLINLEMKYLLILPIIYNNKVIALVELVGLEKPNEEVYDYLLKIQEQLAIGITNATAFVQLENLVDELKKLNDDYQKQNVQIRKQNETLVDLHKKLKEKAEELEIQKEKAEESTKLKSQFLASMSHELRTPMNSILGLTELILEENSLEGKNHERIEVVLKSGKRLMNLINDILDLSKIEAGKMDISKEEVLLDDLIKELEHSISPLIIDKDITFSIIRNTKTNIIINTDRNKVIQVLINLLGNAVKFTDSGTIELKISARGKEKLIFEVSDSGIGISEEDQKLIFEEFRQIDATTTRKYSGTGLGLTICKKISDLLKGTLSVKSKKDEGSTFTFTIPLDFIGEKELKQNQKVNVKTLIKNRKHPILVIDDDPEIRYTIGQYLTSKGYDVEYAEDGAEGVKKAKEMQPFAITLDIMLPKKDGWTVLKELKEEPQTKDIPVILISILADKKLGYGLGAFEYFVKPISSDKLISAFNRLENIVNKRIEKIVIVDDDEYEFERFKKEFKDENVRIHYIQDSELAYSKILEIQPDLIILDLMMPKVDGITLSHKLKSNRETKHIPIILSTAKDLSEEEKNELNDIVEGITVKSKGHALDVLKVVRDRISIQEVSFIDRDLKIETNEDDKNNNKKPVVEEVEDAQGNVCIVDDDVDTLFTVNEIVKSCKYNTILAKSGMECLEILQQQKPDLILLDIMMPELDGFQTLKKIREIDELRGIPIFAVTAKAMVEDKEIIFKHGFDDYIPKPINSGVLAFKLEKAFSNQKLTD